MTKDEIKRNATMVIEYALDLCMTHKELTPDECMNRSIQMHAAADRYYEDQLKKIQQDVAVDVPKLIAKDDILISLVEDEGLLKGQPYIVDSVLPEGQVYVQHWMIDETILGPYDPNLFQRTIKQQPQ